MEEYGDVIQSLIKTVEVLSGKIEGFSNELTALHSILSVGSSNIVCPSCTYSITASELVRQGTLSKVLTPNSSGSVNNVCVQPAASAITKTTQPSGPPPPPPAPVARTASIHPVGSVNSIQPLNVRKMTTRSTAKKGKSEVDLQSASTSAAAVASSSASVPPPPSKPQTQPITSYSDALRRPRSRPISKGTGSIDDNLVAVPKNLHLHVFMFHITTTEEQVSSFLKKKKPELEFTVEKLMTKHERYASFKIGIPEKSFNFFLDPTIWPENVAFNEWSFRRPRPQNKTTDTNMLEKSRY